MLSDDMAQALNEQLGAEMYSSHLYLAMACDFAASGLDGFAHWMELQAREEYRHAHRFRRHILDRGGRVLLPALPAPPASWRTPMEAFLSALEHEQEITQRIHALCTQAVDEGDHATKAFLKWFVDEQVEEEAAAQAVIHKLKMVGDFGPALLHLDGVLGQREA